jgi:hypothetical protein
MSSSSAKNPPISKLTPSTMMTFKTQIRHESRDLVIRMNKAPNLYLPVLLQSTVAMFVPGSEPADRFRQHVIPNLRRYCHRVQLQMEFGEDIPTRALYSPPMLLPASSGNRASSSRHSAAPRGSAAADPSAAQPRPSAGDEDAEAAGADPAAELPPEEAAAWSSDHDSGSDSDTSVTSDSTMYSATSHSVRSAASSYKNRYLDSEPVRLKSGAKVPVFAWVEKVYLRVLAKYLPTRDAEQVHAFESRRFRQTNKDEGLPAYMEEMQEGINMCCPPKSEMDCLQTILSNLGRPLETYVRQKLELPVRKWTTAYLLSKAMVVYEHLQTQMVCRKGESLRITHDDRHRGDSHKPKSGGNGRFQHRAAVTLADDGSYLTVALAPEQPKAGNPGKPSFKGGKSDAKGGKPHAGATKSYSDTRPKPTGPDPGRNAQGQRVCRTCKSPDHLQMECVQFHREKLRELQSKSNNPQVGAAGHHAGHQQPHRAAALMANFIAADTDFDSELHGAVTLLNVTDCAPPAAEEGLVFVPGRGLLSEVDMTAPPGLTEVMTGDVSSQGKVDIAAAWEYILDVLEDPHTTASLQETCQAIGNTVTHIEELMSQHLTSPQPGLTTSSRGRSRCSLCEVISTSES